MNRQFSYADGLAIQQQDLERWKRVLTPTAFERLRLWTAAETGKVNPSPFDAGYSVPRGQDITDFIMKMTYEP